MVYFNFAEIGECTSYEIEDKLEEEISKHPEDGIRRVIKDFPTVYIHNWNDTGKYEVYVGESNDVFRRTREHYDRCMDSTSWQSKLNDATRDAVLYILRFHRP